MYNILICDDEKDIINALKIYLNDPEYRFYEACCSGVILAILTMPIFFFGEKPLMSKRRIFLRRTNEQQA